MDKQTNIQQNNFLGSGWAFPVQFSAGNYQVHTTSGEENVNENIDIILMTRLGERAFLPEFGSGLQQFSFKKMEETLKGEITDMVHNSLLNNEPRITVHDVSVQFTDMFSGLVEILIVYSINQTNTRHNHVYPFYLKEGTNIPRLV